MLFGKRIQAAYDNADYIYCPNMGPTYDIQGIQAAYDSVDYIHWPNVGPTDDSQHVLYIIQLKYTVGGVSKIRVPRDQIYFPRRM